MKVLGRPVRLKPVIAAGLASWMIMLSLGSTAAYGEGYQGRPSTENSLGLQVKAAILVDAQSGQVLYGVNEDEPLPAASMTKLMTEYIVLEEISSGRLSWEEVVTTSAEAASTPPDGSSVFLAQGDQHTVLELYKAMAVGSANDATIALASQISGSEQGFVEKMNEMAGTLGLPSAVFTSATGLSETSVISVRDMAKLARIILTEHPEFLDYSKIQEYKFREKDDAIVNINWMLGTNTNQPGLKHLAYEGVDGMKTGFINSAGYNFTGTVQRGDQRFISVVMDTATKSARFNETAKLYNYGFSTFEKKTVLPPKSVVETIQTVQIKKGKKKSVPVVTEKDITFMVKKGVEPQIELVKSQLKSQDELVAPIAAGTVVGTVTYKYTDAETKQSLEHTVNLVTNAEAEKAGWFRLMFRAIGDFFAGLFNGIVNLF
ncbi:D-alanyl-D-alanine carboxypeptidase family protein [Paenibacillus arenilitoris]|uniref:serine-type D-Ala-D-Ala carboxypeptidase n=1 Tax=Paenibacillus arenilitoris TaxID=2772299 RepID=A0A927H8G6_9BACL|nr:D-alanyl-D-alanine carboxypeptidase family protein [Paenibacillus arenilitoris]MBD2871668.1 D-alanyl-D-alanine carboxypeptidase [Paenibacillus arenilitoris]